MNDYRLFVSSWPTELPNRYFQDGYFWKGYDLALMDISFVFINSCSKVAFSTNLMLKIDSAASS